MESRPRPVASKAGAASPVSGSQPPGARACLRGPAGGSRASGCRARNGGVSAAAGMALPLVTPEAALLTCPGPAQRNTRKRWPESAWLPGPTASRRDAYFWVCGAAAAFSGGRRPGPGLCPSRWAAIWPQPEGGGPQPAHVQTRPSRPLSAAPQPRDVGRGQPRLCRADACPPCPGLQAAGPSPPTLKQAQALGGSRTRSRLSRCSARHTAAGWGGSAARPSP